MVKIDYSDSKMIDLIKASRNCSDFLKSIGLSPRGANYATVKRWVKDANIDISHWSSYRGWNKGQKLKDWSEYKTNSHIKKHLIKTLGHKCENCLVSVWYDYPIILEIHHMDGNRLNNDLTNLQLLCPNCHAMTDNWRGRKNDLGRIPTDTERLLRPLTLAIGLRGQKNKKKITKPKFVKLVEVKQPYIRKTKIDWPDDEVLIHMIKTQPLLAIAKELGVSDSGIRGRAKRRGINIKELSRWSKKHGSFS